ncbi:MAG: hypothetical protein V1770_02275 [bacterium]
MKISRYFSRWILNSTLRKEIKIRLALAKLSIWSKLGILKIYFSYWLGKPLRISQRLTKPLEDFQKFFKKEFRKELKK